MIIVVDVDASTATGDPPIGDTLPLGQSISFRAQADADAEIRTATLYGREYTVVPVVALVEGVLQGMNAETPELALASEFGAIPPGWNGRPVVMNHPVEDGNPVSANSPTVLEEWAFGQLFNTTLDGTKLKTEAWLDNERMSALGGEFADVLTRLQSGTTIEVSTGLYTLSEKKTGKFNGKTYGAIWRNIVPDHLAFLSEGVLGACSVEDGCGTPRVNSAAGASTPWKEYAMSSAEIRTNCDGGSACTCKDKDKPKVNGESEGSNVATLALEQETNEEFAVLRRKSPHQPIAVQADLKANGAPADMIYSDVWKLLSKALRDTTTSYIWVLGLTSEKVIYETYSNDGKYNYLTYQRSYTVASNTSVTLGDDIQEVNLLTSIVPVVAADGLNLNSTSTTEQETSMAGESETTTTQTEGTSGTVDGNAVTTPAVNASTTQETAPAAPVAPRTMSQYLSDMPEEMREVFTSGLKLHNQKKEGIIKTLKDSGRNKFTDDQLRGMSMDMLENLASLADVKPSYEGVATPRANAAPGGDDNAPPPAPKVFERKAANAA